jgi:pimeloyl-ACP methyl ester carboxylesterase
MFRMNACNPSPRPRLDLITLLISTLALACPAAARAMTPDRAVALCRDYLAAASSHERQAVLRQITAYDGPIDPVIQRLATRTYRPVKPGNIPQEHFANETLRKKHPDDLLYFLVPQDYRAEQPTGLIVFEHGGGAHTPRRVAGAAFLAPGPHSPDSASGDLFAATGMIAVGPSSLDKPSYRRWCLEESDDYIADVILECKDRFHIDPDRVFLIGHSMGGFGAYQAALRYPDRFAAIVAHSGSWRLGYWPALRGTPLCFVNGVNDARQGVRDHSTDVQYGRLTDQILTREHLEHSFFEHGGAHAFSSGRKYAFDYLRGMKDRRRDPYYDHIGLASPNGFRESYSYPLKDNRWLTLDKTVPGNIDYDELIPHDQATFAGWRLEHHLAPHPGASLDAVNRRDNTIAVAAQNVARFTVWLHPRMVDVSRPVTIIVDGKARFSGRVAPSLATALESYERRQDWGLIYPIKVVVDLPK